MSEPHDIHDFVVSSQRAIEAEYARIQKRVREDTGTAGDQGEENWAFLFREWLPSYFHIVTKGRILTESGYASDQIDVLVLMPSYPKLLLDKKLYLAAGVAAAFECKITLEAHHVKQAVKTCADLRQNLPKRYGTPFRELQSEIPYGLLAHSHSWKEKKSKPLENVETALQSADSEVIKHPIECIDLICVADLATWTTQKIIYHGPRYLQGVWDEHAQALYGPDGSAITSYICHAIGGERQAAFFSPLGVLLSQLFSKLAWSFEDMRRLEKYFRTVEMPGTGKGRMRAWPLHSVYSPQVLAEFSHGRFSNGEQFDEWNLVL